MPRKCNATEYDAQMSVFKQNPSRSQSQRRSNRSNTQIRTSVSNTTASVNTSSLTPYTEYNSPSGALPGSTIPTGHTVSFPWSGPAIPSQPPLPDLNAISSGELYPGVAYQPSSYNPQFPEQESLSNITSPMYASEPYSGASDTSMTSGQPIVTLNNLTRGEKRTALANVAYDLPSFLCACGAKVRVLQPQIFSIPNTEILWNFKHEQLRINQWQEGTGNDVECPICRRSQSPTLINLAYP